jgi:hypothetical protein
MPVCPILGGRALEHNPEIHSIKIN